MGDSKATHLRPRQIAEQLDVSLRTVRRWIANGTLPSVKIGGVRLVAEDDLLRLVQQ
jgi:excisionase family DNA binding protein